MNIIIVGCTKVGVILATDLCVAGHQVAVIDSNHNAFKSLPKAYNGITVEGVAMDISVLEKAGISESDALVTVTEDDNFNIVVAQLARQKFGLTNVVARIADSVRENFYQELGLKTVCPTNIESATIFNTVTGEAFDELVEFGNRKARFVTREDSTWTGKMVCDIPLFKGELVYAIIDTDGEIELAHDRSRVIMSGERIVFTSLAD